MPVAAVPEYLGRDFSEASPGLRFGLYLPLWTERADQERQVMALAGKRSREAGELKEILDSKGMDAAIKHARARRGRLPALWEKNDHEARDAWRTVARLTPDDVARGHALQERQSAMIELLESAGQAAVFHARSVAPFTTGLGNEHPLENGFAFLWPYGLPYLPGSGVKGVLRQAARELAGVGTAAQWALESDWTAEAIDALFGSEDSAAPARGALQFWDVIPGIRGDSLMLEVMTAHQSHYYQKGESPHESGQPNPINYLTVPPGSAFAFHVVCDLSFLRGRAPELAENGRWKALLEQAFAHAFDWLGFGARTAVGYGAMAVDESAAEVAEQRRREREEEARVAAMTEEERQIDELRSLFERERAAGRLAPNGPVAEQRLRLLEAARGWTDPGARRAAGALLREIARALPWSKKRAKEARAILAELLGESE